MKILVTGGLGFIGSHLSSTLIRQGFDVTIVDSLSDYYSIDLKMARQKYLLKNLSSANILKFNLSDRKSFANLVDDLKPQVVIHLAAQAGVRIPVEQIHKYTESNLTGFSNVLQTVIEKKIPSFLYASSSSVYGDSIDFPYKETATNIKPISFYGATKLSNEILANSLTIGSNTRTRGMRFFTVYGPWGRPDMAYFTYVDDTVQAVIKLVDQLNGEPEGFSDIVNVAGGQPHSLNDLITEFESISGKRVDIINEAKASGDVRVTVADTNYLENLTRFKPSISLSEGTRKFFDWASSYEHRNSLRSWIDSGEK
jgi:UDP-glucuronate 4-epimerase